MPQYYNEQRQDHIVIASCPPWVVKAVQPQTNYTLVLTFANGEKRIYNALPLLEKAIYAPLKDLQLFMEAKVAGDSVCWNDEVDIAPEHLYECSVTVYK